MKLKSICRIIPLLFWLVFTACNDDINDIGESVKPNKDNIAVATEYLKIGAKTISMKDSVYARTINGVLGQYNDDTFGSIKADYLAEFYWPSQAKFEDNFISIDSVQFAIGFTSYEGDSLSPMGLTIFELNKSLEKNFYTTVNPSNYYRKSDIMANQAFTINGARKVTSSTNKKREIVTKLDKAFGQRIYDIASNKLKKDSFKGVYVTTTFGSGTLINILSSNIDVYYKYKDIKGNYNGTQDTIRTTYFSLAVTDEVIQLNHIKNSYPEGLFTEGTGATYMKTPAGVYTELKISISEISQRMKDLNMKSVNTAQLIINGYTEKETNNGFSLKRPPYFLLVDNDSIDNFFTKRGVPNGISSFYTSRNSTYNTYSFNNLSAMIEHYRNKNVNELTLRLVPIEIKFNTTVSPVEPINVYNYLQPSTAVLRSDTANLKLKLIYSRFNN